MDLLKPMIRMGEPLRCCAVGARQIGIRDSFRALPGGVLSASPEFLHASGRWKRASQEPHYDSVALRSIPPSGKITVFSQLESEGELD